MSDILYKATRPDGTDFRTGTIDYAAGLSSGTIVVHPTSSEVVRGRASTYISTATRPEATLLGGAWPCRLFRVEAVGEAVPATWTNRTKVAVTALRVLEELPAHLALGPQGEHVVRLIDKFHTAPVGNIRSISRAAYAAYAAAYAAAYDAAAAAAYAAYAAAYDAAYDAAADAAYDAAAARALVVRHLIGQHGFTQEHYDALTGPVRSTLGKIHPDDEEM